MSILYLEVLKKLSRSKRKKAYYSQLITKKKLHIESKMKRKNLRKS